MESQATFTPVGRSGLTCSIKSPRGLSLSLSGVLSDIEPDSDGDLAMVGNHALVLNLWAFGKHEKQYRLLRNPEKRKSHERQAKLHKKVAINLARLIDLEGTGLKRGWCSACLTYADHRKLELGGGRVPAYLCRCCGSPTLGCAAPGCPNMANRGFGPLRIPRYCAEHRHDIPSFEKVNSKFGPLENYRDFLTYEARDWSKSSKVASAVTATGLAIATGGYFYGAQIVGGAIGSLASSSTGAGLTGAAATNYGLALLGGGSLAAGGLGMAGGTAVVAGLGGLLGGGLGALITVAYIGDDKSFRIDKLRHGSGTPVIVASGFLTEGGDSWGDWEQIIQRRYPDSPVYRVHWGSKELRALGALVGGGAGKAGVAFMLKAAASKASKSAAKKVPVVGAALLAADLAKNPWHTAKVRADSTGVALAGLLSRTDAENYILLGHSLGARAMVTAAQTLATSPDGPKINAIHLLGAAIGSKGDWRSLNDAVSAAVYNYYSSNDKVLKYLYAVVQAGSKPVGLCGFGSKFPKIKDRNVSQHVDSHSDYLGNVQLA